MFDEEPDGDPHGECKLEIDRLEAELAKYQWQPIETAPEDGTEILLCDYYYRVASGGFDGHCWAWPYVRREPTHWMHLPPEPKL